MLNGALPRFAMPCHAVLCWTWGVLHSGSALACLLTTTATPPRPPPARPPRPPLPQLCFCTGFSYYTMTALEPFLAQMPSWLLIWVCGEGLRHVPLVGIPAGC